MKAITLWQPWATLVALGWKNIETRSWSTTYRGPLAIHAATRRPEYGEFGPWLCEPLYYDVRHVEECACDEDAIDVPCARRSPSTMALTAPSMSAQPLPVGVVVATCELVDVVPMVTPEFARSSAGRHDCVLIDGADMWQLFPSIGVNYDISAERPFGDFAPGRFAWFLESVRQLEEPIPARGRQQLWNWNEEGAA